MRSSTWRLEDLRNAKLNLGFVGENEHTRFIFDSKKMYDQYPNAAVSMTVCPPEGASYPAIIERDGDLVIWDVTDSDLIHDGDGEIQLSFTQGETVAKTYIAKTTTCRALVPEGDIPEGIDDFLTRAGAALTAIPETIDEALAEAKASGEFDGPQGPAGQDGTDGQDGYSPTATVTKSGKVATITITDKNGTTTAEVHDGDDGGGGGGGTGDYEDLENLPQIGGVTLKGNKSLHDLGIAAESDIPDPTSIIDDTAGDGDTNKTWSADKLADVKSEINSLTTATTSDVGKALSPKTVSNGKVTEWQYKSIGGGGGGGSDIDDTAGAGDTDKAWSADKLTTEFGELKFWDGIEPEPVNGLGYVVKGNVSEEASLKSSGSWQYLKFDVSKYDKISVSTIIYGSTYYGIIFVNASNVIISMDLLKGSDADETITDQIISVPANTKYAYINKHSSVSGNVPGAKYLLTTDAIPQMRKDINIIDDSVIWRYMNGEGVDNMRIGGTTGSAYTTTGSNSWRYSKFEVKGHDYLKISTVIYGSSNLGYYFVDSNNIIIELGLYKGSNETETITDYLVKVPSTAKYILVNKRSSTDGDSPVVKGIATADEMASMTELRILSFNCGQFDYGDGTTTDAQYKTKWREMLNDTKFDICALQDYISTFGQLQDEAKDVLFGSTIKSFLGYVGSSENGLRLASRINAGYLGCIDVGGGSGLWRTKVYKYNVFAMGKNIVVYVGHYQSQTQYATARATQYANVIADAQAYGYEYVVFVGDFNAESISEYAPFVNAGYILCNGGYTGDHITLGPGETGWENIPTDNIIYSPNLMETHFEVLSDQTLNTDHYPIMATLKVKS